MAVLGVELHGDGHAPILESRVRGLRGRRLAPYFRQIALSAQVAAPEARGPGFLESGHDRHRELDAQYRQLREECGLLDRSERGKLLLVSGPDAAEYLQGQLTNDIEALAPGEGSTRRCSTARATCRPTCGCCGRATGRSWLDTEPSRRAAALPPPDDVQGRPRGRVADVDATSGRSSR